MRVETASRLLAAAGVRWVRFEIADIRGVVRSKSVPLARFPVYGSRGLALSGAAARHSAEDGDDAAQSRRDVLLLPDLDTLAVVPHAPGDARVLCDVLHLDLEPAEDDARGVLRHIVERYLDEGLMPLTGFAYQFRLVDRATRAPVFSDRSSSPDPCQAAGGDRFATWRDTFLNSLPSLGVDLASFALADAPGKLAVTIEPARGLAAGDNAFSLVTAAREIAGQHDLTAAFMAKPFINRPGSACFLSHGLVDAGTGVNRFSDPDDPFGLSTLGRHFLAGLLYHAPALTALLAPLPNSYKRLRAADAPVNISWGIDNRTVAFRVPHLPRQTALAPGMPADDTWIESRIGGADIDPYSALAASLAAGLDGIQRQLLPPEPVLIDAAKVDGAAALPDSLDAALEALESDAPLRELLGEPFVRSYAFVKRFDIARTRLACPDYGYPEWRERVDPIEWSEHGEPR